MIELPPSHHFAFHKDITLTNVACCTAAYYHSPHNLRPTSGTRPTLPRVLPIVIKCTALDAVQQHNVHIKFRENQFSACLGRGGEVCGRKVAEKHTHTHTHTHTV